MVRTRSKSLYIDRQDLVAEPNAELAMVHDRISLNRVFNQARQSPRKVTQNKNKQKSKRQSGKINNQLSTIKRNLSKATDRAIPNVPDKPKTLFEVIHEPILNGEAKRNLRPVVIVID